MEVYDNCTQDVQATPVDPVSPELFDFAAFEAHEAELLPRCKHFIESDRGVAVYRRIRSGDVFLDGCRDRKESLALQLGALQKSMSFQADIPNFLEPWYGIGVAASAFGAEYIWNEGQAPATKPLFQDVKQALSFPAVPIRTTNIGRYILETIDYFMEKTGGKLPISLTDVQSPLNVACGLVGIDNLLLQSIDDPDSVEELLQKIALLAKEFIGEQLNHLDSNLVFPGHGFASSRCFKGLGMSDDNALMLSPALYEQIAIPAMRAMAKTLSGPVFHSCGNWEHLAPTIAGIPDLNMVDGAFGGYTDPAPNTPEEISKVFNHTGIIVNARIVGDADVVLRYVKRLWNDDLKLIVVTYCDTPEQQQYAYRQIQNLSQPQTLPPTITLAEFKTESFPTRAVQEKKSKRGINQ